MKIKVIIAGALLITGVARSQDYTNLKYSSPLSYNPALTGLQNDKSANLRFTNSGEYSSMYGDYSQYSKKLHGGIGFYLNARGKGNNKRFSEAGLNYAYQNKFNDKWNYSVGASFQFSGRVHKSKDELKTFFDAEFGLGTMIFTDKFFTSFTAQNLFTPYSSFDLGIGREFTSNHFSVTPSVNLISQFGRLDADVNVAMRYKKIHLGLTQGNARASASVGYQFNRFRVNYNFGIQDEFNNFSHEVSLKFNLNKVNSARSKFKINLF